MTQLILAIETSIKNGSLSLLEGTQEIDSWAGHEDISRSEDLLPQIKQLLDQNGASLKQVEMIAVSVGPGSFTGLRVGIATAKALALATDCRIVGSAILESVAAYLLSGALAEKVITVAVSAGRGHFFWQSFMGKGAAAISEIETGEKALLESRCEILGTNEVFMESNAYRDYQQGAANQKLNVQIIEENFAKLIGLHAFSISVISGFKQKNRDILPLYIRPAIIKK